MVVKAIIMHFRRCKISSHSEKQIMHSYQHFCSDRRLNMAFAGQTEVRCLKFFKSYILIRCSPSFYHKYFAPNSMKICQ